MSFEEHHILQRSHQVTCAILTTFLDILAETVETFSHQDVSIRTNFAPEAKFDRLPVGSSQIIYTGNFHFVCATRRLSIDAVFIDTLFSKRTRREQAASLCELFGEDTSGGSTSVKMTGLNVWRQEGGVGVRLPLLRVRRPDSRRCDPWRRGRCVLRPRPIGTLVAGGHPE